MTIGLARKLLVTASAALFVAATLASSAQAALTISLQATDLTNGGPVLTASTTTNTLLAGGTAGDFDLSVTSNRNGSGNNTTGAQLSTTTFTVQNAGNNPSTIEILISATEYNLPVGSVILSSSASGSSAFYDASNSATLQSYVDTGNNGDNTFATTALGSMTATSGPQTGLPISGSLTGAYDFGTSATVKSSAFVTPTTGFSETQRLTITLNALDSVTLTLNSNLRAVPEPAPIAMALSSLPVLVGLLRNRRRSRA